MRMLRSHPRRRRRRARRKKRRSLRRRVVTALLITVLGFLGLTASVVLGLRWLNPPSSSFIVQRAIQSYREGVGQTGVLHRWTSWTDVPTHVCLAVVAAEDQRFPAHHGFDFDALRQALDDHGRGGRLRGASTISQQLAKNLFLWRGRSWIRKGFEAYFTVLMEGLWTKERILEVYLNSVQFGDRVFGVEAAAGHYFGKPVSALTPTEAALLAAVLPNPVKFRVDSPSAYLLERVDWIGRQMRALGNGYLTGIC